MTNRLASEASLYLRQHADNPVDWHPWGEEALQIARRERKPILLSIGYSACHWCHVMAHESFEDEATAQVMNALYVNIKVDREERPDLDRIYQLAHQALSRRGGGWPLTVFLAPDDLVPFFAGTYFPPQSRHGLPSFVDVLQGVRGWFDTKPGELAQQTAALGEFLANHGRGEGRVETLDDAPLKLAMQRIHAGFDAQHGGHRGGPKFPPCTELELLLRFADDDEDSAAMAEHTLRKMAERGLQDHLLGGFFRYCVDAHWGIPHFEKMLYDNAGLLALYADAAGTVEEDEEFVAAAEGIVRWLQRDMRVATGGFASAMDADSEGEEGAFYLWQRGAVTEALAADPQRDDFVRTFGLDAPPNFEGHAWHLQRDETLAHKDDFAGARATLLRLRDARVWPARDDKQLTAWNAMMVRALSRAALRMPRGEAADTGAWDSTGSPRTGVAEAGDSTGSPRTGVAGAGDSTGSPRTVVAGAGDSTGSPRTGVAEAGDSTGSPRTGVAEAGDSTGSPRTGAAGTGADAWLAVADEVLASLRARAWRDGRLLAVAGKESLRGYLDDHAFLLDALLERLQARWDDADAEWARQLADTLLDDFEDTQEGGFFFTPHAHETLPQRPKPWFDEATPSGNGVAARALLRIGFLLGETRFLDAAERTLRAGLAATRDAPHGACSLLAALHEYLAPGAVVILRATPAEASAWQPALRDTREAGAITFVLPPDSASMPDKRHAAGGVAYVCRGMQCSPPANSPAELETRLAG